MPDDARCPVAARQDESYTWLLRAREDGSGIALQISDRVKFTNKIEVFK